MQGMRDLAELARELELGEPTLPWHAVRVRPAMLAGAHDGMPGVRADEGRGLARPGVVLRAGVGEGRRSRTS